MVSTEFTDQVEYLAFKDKLRTTLIYVAIAFGIGFVLAFKDGIGAAFFIGVAFACCLILNRNHGNMNIQKEGNTVDCLPDIVRIKNNRNTWSELICTQNSGHIFIS